MSLTTEERSYLLSEAQALDEKLTSINGSTGKLVREIIAATAEVGELELEFQRLENSSLVYAEGPNEQARKASRVAYLETVPRWHELQALIPDARRNLDEKRAHFDNEKAVGERLMARLQFLTAFAKGCAE